MATRSERDDGPENEPRGQAREKSEPPDAADAKRPPRSVKKPDVVSRPASRRRARPAVVIPSEPVIDSPTKHTLWMLGALAFAIVAMWSASRFACNAHPMQTRKPREVSTADLAREPKEAALELAQRWAAYDFGGALELAKGPIADQIKKDQQQCEKDKSGCENKKKDSEQQVLASAVLLSREMDRARARVTTTGGAAGKESFVLELTREGGMWKGVQKLPDSAGVIQSPLRAPSASLTALPLAPSPAPKPPGPPRAPAPGQ